MSTSAGPNIVKDGLVLCLDIGNNESYPNTGTSWKDLSGNENIGTFNYISIDFNNAKNIYFNGINSYISANNPPNIGTGPYTFSAWVKTSVATSQMIASSWDGTNPNGVHFANITTNGKLYAYAGSAYTTNSKNLADGNWYYITVVRNSGVGYFYINGDFVESGNIGNNNASLGNFRIGSRGNSINELLIGNISNIMIYNRELSSLEIKQNFNTTKGRFIDTPTLSQQTSNAITDGLIFNLDAGNTNSYPGTGDGTIWYDLSSNKYHGSLINGPIYNNSNGGSIIFDGVNDYYIGYPYGTLLGNKLTISLWVYPTSSNNGIFQFAENLNATTPWLLCKRTNSTTVDWYFRGNYRLSNSVNNNTWYNLVLTCDSTTWKTYTNSILSSTTTISIAAGAGNLYLANGYPTFFGGRISNFQIYNRDLSDSEILQNFNTLRGRFGL